MSVESTQIGTVESIDIFLEELKCSGCREVMGAPIYVCENGHSVCTKCTEQGSYICPAPDCAQLIPASSRNKALEAISLLARIRCLNPGCDKMFRNQDRVDHERHCQYRIVDCLVCDLKDTFINIAAHMEKEHSSKVVPLNSAGSVDPIRTHKLPQVNAFLSYKAFGDILVFGIVQDDDDTYSEVIHFKVQHAKHLGGHSKLMYSLNLEEHPTEDKVPQGEFIHVEEYATSSRTSRPNVLGSKVSLKERGLLDENDCFYGSITFSKE